jgi:alpha-methylacyl-CoA racemase
MTFMYGMRAQGHWKDEREANILDGAAPFYTTYECSDGRHVAVGPIERQFYAAFIQALGTDDPRLTKQMSSEGWPEQKALFAEIFKTRSRDEWVNVFENTEACVAPVLSMDEAPHHPHNVARQTFVTRQGVRQPAPAPRFSRTREAIREPDRGSVAQRLKTWNLPDDILSAFGT